jgi:predicted SAM-dependent methyltransferase
VCNKFGYSIQRLPTSDISLYYQIFDKEAVEAKRFYNIGAGLFRHPAWTNIDHGSKWYKDNPIDIDLDLLSLKPIPIDNCIAEIVYSSHTIEHITNEASQNMFNQSFRILKNGGIFRVTTPNIDLDYQAYKRNDKHYFHSESRHIGKDPNLIKPVSDASIQQLFLLHFASSRSTMLKEGAEERIDDEKLDIVFRDMKYEDALNFCISKCSLNIQNKYVGYHLNWWNESKLLRMLRHARFSNIYRSGYGQSVSPVLRNTEYFDNTHPKTSIYIEALK